VREGEEGIGAVAGNGVAAYYAFTSGVTGHYESYAGDRAGGRCYGLDLYCAGGVIALRDLPQTEAYRYPHGLWLPATEDGRWERVLLPEWEAGADGAPRTKAEKLAESNRRNAMALLNAITADRDPELASSGRDALAALEMVMAPAESQRLGCRVPFPLEQRGNPYEVLRLALSPA